MASNLEDSRNTSSSKFPRLGVNSEIAVVNDMSLVLPLSLLSVEQDTRPIQTWKCTPCSSL